MIEPLLGQRRPMRLSLTGVSAMAAALVLVGVSGATPSGQNGLISYRVYFDSSHSTGALFVMNPDGTDQTQITFPGDGNLDTNQNWSPEGTQLVYEHDTADGSSSTGRSVRWDRTHGRSSRAPAPACSRTVSGFSTRPGHRTGSGSRSSWCSVPSIRTAIRLTTRSGPSTPTAAGCARSPVRSTAPRSIRARSGHPIPAGSPSSATSRQTSSRLSGQRTQPPALTSSASPRRA